MNASDPLLKQLELARRELLELSTQNRLLNTARDPSRGLSVEIKDESADQVFRTLISESKSMRFEQGELVEIQTSDSNENPSEEPDNSPPKKTKRVTRKRASTKSVKALASSVGITDTPETRTSDDILHTELSPDELDRRLLGLATDATATFQDQGVNVLYLALGFLKWFEKDRSDTPRYAPLLLIPVKLQRGTAGVRYSLVYTGDDIETNLTLKTRLHLDFGIQLPGVPETEELSPSVYFQDVKQQVGSQNDWEVLPNDIVLWFFSFTKLLMYRDLDPATWPDSMKLQDRPLVRALLQDGFASATPLCKAEERIDTLLDPANTMHVIDSDSSQTIVVEEICRGRSLVIQGPPGTGKSQTITNLIAGAVRAGKSVLFVAEKMAALQVVKRRLTNIGLGDLCLELHSDLANKKIVLDEVKRTAALGMPVESAEIAATIKRVTELRDQLNLHADRIHTPLQPSNLTPYKIISELVSLRTEGAALPTFQIASAEQWSEKTYQSHAQALTEFVEAWKQIEHPKSHPWRGCQLEQILPMDLERQVALCQPLVNALDELSQNCRKLAQQLGDDLPATLGAMERLVRTALTLVAAPKTDVQSLINTVWDDQRATVGSLAEAGRTLLKTKESLESHFTDSAWNANIDDACQAYRLYGNSWFRIFRARYRNAKQTLKGILKGPLPATNDQALALLDDLAANQKAQRAVADGDRLGVMAFGQLWQGKLTDWKQLDAWEAWDAKALQCEVSPRFRNMLAGLSNRDELKAILQIVEPQLQKFIEALQILCKNLKFDLNEAFGSGAPTSLATDGMKQYSVVDLRERLVAWQTRPEALQTWQNYTVSRSNAAKVAAGEFVKRMDSGELGLDQVLTSFRFAYFEGLLRHLMQQHPDLATFDGGKFQRLIDEFQSLDQKRITFARNEVAIVHFKRMQQLRDGRMHEAKALLRAEMQKKRRHLPLRQLLGRAGPAIQAIKPVMMMSPLSIAQYLEPGKLEFDLLVIDEASQVRPVEALGAAARCRQMVTVGDDKQMPPTQFFGVVVGDVAEADDADDDAIHAGDVESILGLCMARNMPQRMLRWHYRSRHQSLIAVSNQQFYDGQLYVVPSPERDGELGLKFRWIEQGRFIDRVNLEEAKAVAQAVIEHAKTHPQWTLGVGAFSVSQRDVVLKEVERLRREHPETEPFFDPSAPDPFFIKNLENIQGDERDVIIVSVGYGPDENGRVNLNFGPVSSSGGERRLNVLMTRAKRRCEIFSSLRAEHLDLTRATGRGPAVFRAFLEFAQRGGQLPQKHDRVTEDQFISALQKQLQQRGYQTQTSVGVAGIFIDLAVVDPNDPDRYLLGIEVDGPSYRDARSARDRDRLREQVLTGQGWQLYRIWSWEWFQRPVEQFNRLVEAIEKVRRGERQKPKPTLSDAVYVIERKPPGEDVLGSESGINTEGSPSTNESVGGSFANAATEVLGNLLRKGAEEVIDAAKKKLESELQLPRGTLADQSDEKPKSSTESKAGSRSRKKKLVDGED